VAKSAIYCTTLMSLAWLIGVLADMFLTLACNGAKQAKPVPRSTAANQLQLAALCLDTLD
jgi:hypothetical protein